MAAKMKTELMQKAKISAFKATTEKAREMAALRYVCEVLADVCERKSLGSALTLVMTLARCYRDVESDAANRGKSEAVQRAKATLDMLDYAGELHESWFPKPSKTKKKARKKV